MLKSQQNIQALFTDQAAENAAAQFNATSENQTNQFFANLLHKLHSLMLLNRMLWNSSMSIMLMHCDSLTLSLQQQRDLFNAQNGLVLHSLMHSGDRA